MQFYLPTIIFCLLPGVISTAIPVADPLPAESSLNSTLFERDIVAAELISRDPQKGKNEKKDKKGKKEDCQKPIAQNLCTSGAPYCCSGEGDARVCGPASSVSCEVMTICCINTNGMQICAGEIDFTGPVTININYGRMK
ncbi:hypothetical protein SVAN01_01543 [Stagonosporopsis vannaccii]|nr:hypothetical protein SVAN01_01543 [Stagonosporopsis vannaccii]